MLRYQQEGCGEGARPCVPENGVYVSSERRISVLVDVPESVPYFYEHTAILRGRHAMTKKTRTPNVLSSIKLSQRASKNPET